MAKPFIIAGYAAPFNQAHVVDGVRETIKPRAFLVGNAVDLLWGRHDGPRLANNTGLGALEFWNDDYGLAFRAELPDGLADDRLEGAFYTMAWQASVNFVDCGPSACRPAPFLDSLREQAGAILRDIEFAKIDHIAIVPTGTAKYGDATGVWREDVPDELQRPENVYLRSLWAASNKARLMARAEFRAQARLAKADPVRRAALEAVASGTGGRTAAARLPVWRRP
jgi:hypothetical protein